MANQPQLAEGNNKPTSKPDKQLSPLANTASLVVAYARRISGDQRAQQFMAQISLMAQKEPKLAQCDQNSLLDAMMKCVHLDMMPNTPEGLAYIIPYGREAQFQLGYKGMVKLAYRSGMIQSISAELVFPEDDFMVSLGTDRKLTHTPSFKADRTKFDKATHVYATARLMSGETVFEVLTPEELAKVRNASKSGATGPWATWPEEMAKKTVLKRLLKYLPQSTKQELAMHVDDGGYRVNQQGDLVEDDKAEYIAPVEEAA